MFCKKVKYFFIGILIGTLFIILLSIGFSYFFRDEIKGYVLDELTKNLNADIKIEKTSISVLRDFPNVSLVCKNVIISPISTKNLSNKAYNNDTLLFSKLFLVNLNIYDVLTDSKVIKTIKIKSSTLNILVDHYGNENYNIFNKLKGSHSHFFLQLENIEFTDLDINYINEAKNITFITNAKKIVINGNISSNEQFLVIKGNTNINLLRIDQVDYLINRNIKLNGNFNIFGDTYRIQNGIIEIDKLTFIWQGEFIAGKPNIVNFKLKGQHMRLKSLVSLLPNTYQEYFKNYQSKGLIIFNSNIEGKLDNLNFPHFNVFFRLANGEIIFSDEKLRLENVSLKGLFSNGIKNSSATTFVSLDSISCNYLTSNLKGSMHIRNFITPCLNIKAEGELVLNNFSSFIPDNKFTISGGRALVNVYIDGSIHSLKKFSKEEVKRLNYRISANFKDANLGIKNSNQMIENINGNIRMNKNLWFNLTGKYNKTDIDINGKILDFSRNILNDLNRVNIQASINSNQFNLQDILYIYSLYAENNYESSFFPGKELVLGLKCNFKGFRYYNFYASDVFSDIMYYPRRLYVNSFEMDGMDGRITGNGYLYSNEEDFLLNTEFHLSQVNIQKLFFACDNFGQDAIVSSNLNGKFFGTINFSTHLTDSFLIKKESVVAETSFEIKEGELIGYKPMLGLSKYIQVDELKHIKFSNLKNHIIIKDQVIHIPYMDIYSSAFNISGSGTHDFNNNYNYNIKVLFSELLWKKTKPKWKNTEFGRIEDDGLGRTGIFLSINGNLDNMDDFEVDWDKKTTIESVRKDIKEEVQQVKSLLKDEFGIFKKDSSVNLHLNNKSKDKRVIIQVEEEEKEEFKDNKKDILYEKPEYQFEWNDTLD